MQLYLLPYKAGSRSCKALAEELGIRRIRVRGSRWTPSPFRTVVNWGNSAPNLDIGNQVINHPDAVLLASNKLTALQAMKDAGVSVPEFRTPQDVTEAFVSSPFIARTHMRGSGGLGCYYIEELGPGNEIHIPDRVQLYVRYIKKSAEYRIHVFQGEVLDIQQKRKRNDVEDADFKIRNHANGWVFCRNHVDPPHQSVLSSAVDAVRALGLDFGAVDVIWNQFHGAYVLEVNTAPGLEGTTLQRYKEKLDAMR